jgi:hypothetical protein
MRFEFSGPHLSEDSVTEVRNPSLMRRILNFVTGSQTNMQQIAELRRAIAKRDEMLVVAHRREQELLLLLDVATKRREQELDPEVEERPRTEQQRITNEQASRLTIAYDVYMTSRSKNKLRILMATLRSHGCPRSRFWDLGHHESHGAQAPLAPPQVLAYNFPTLAHNQSMNNGHSLGQFRYTVHCPPERGTPLPPPIFIFRGNFLHVFIRAEVQPDLNC